MPTSRAPLPGESPRRTSRACSQGPRLWTEEVILAPKPLAPFSPRDLFLVTPGPVNRTFCPHQPAPPTPFWGRGPEQVFSAFQGNGSHPGARTRKCWKPRENADCCPPHSFRRPGAGPENRHSDELLGAAAGPGTPL